MCRAARESLVLCVHAPLFVSCFSCCRSMYILLSGLISDEFLRRPGPGDPTLMKFLGAQNTTSHLTGTPAPHMSIHPWYQCSPLQWVAGKLLLVPLVGWPSSQHQIEHLHKVV